LEKNYLVTSFYRFSSISEHELGKIELRLRAFSRNTALRGLVITAQEGMNGTVAGKQKDIDALKDLICSMVGFEQTEFKDSWSDFQPFKRFKVKRRPEIVTFTDSDILPDESDSSHLAPAEWDKVLEEESGVLLLDTRNKYETSLGMFDGAIDPEIDVFTQFSDFVRQLEVPLETKVLMYCTGGIRCEKASLEMKRRGFSNVYQLKGGILKYLEEFPGQKFKGECFVFDHRVALDQELNPSVRYRLCPHCGDPGDQLIECSRCEKEAVICSECHKVTVRQSCSKDCCHHLGLSLQESDSSSDESSNK